MRILLVLVVGFGAGFLMATKADAPRNPKDIPVTFQAHQSVTIIEETQNDGRLIVTVMKIRNYTVNGQFVDVDKSPRAGRRMFTIKIGSGDNTMLITGIEN